MDSATTADAVQKQRLFFATGQTKPVAFRLAQLTKLQTSLHQNEKFLAEALAKDLGKCFFEAFTAEIGFVLEDIRLALKHLNSWAKPRRVGTPLIMQPGSSWIYPEPKGVVLVIAPWNYPLQLTLAPVVAAIAAGNCIVIKPSEFAPATAALITQLIEQCFPPEYCSVIQGGIDETQDLLSHRFDHIFFTGSTAVGKVVMRAAAEHLTPVTLELGGKSPCIIDEGVNLEVTARRVVWGKFYNAGQTCVAPDYLLVPRSMKQALIDHMKKAMVTFYGVYPEQSPDYGRIIHERHFDRLVHLMQGARVVAGGEHNRQDRYIAPTILDEVTLDTPLMAEEIFGPLLPLLAYDTLDQALDIVRQRPHPLACYVFTQRPEIEKKVLSELSFGGGCVNNALMHLLSPHLPFGGIGTSGMGAYHGKTGFDTFSHQKSIYKSPMWPDIPLKYPPYKGQLAVMRRLLG